MGKGTFQSGKFQLFVTFSFPASSAKIEQWKNAFQHASNLLFEATDGQMEFGTIYYGNNNAGKKDSDIRLQQLYCVDRRPRCSNEPGPGCSSGSGGTINGVGYMTLFDDETERPYVIVHEFGHYALGLHDEYRAPFGRRCSACCTDDAAGEHACIMEFSSREGLQINPTTNTIVDAGVVNRFCSSATHCGKACAQCISVQQYYNKGPCWDTIVDCADKEHDGICYPDHGVVGPPPGEKPQGPPADSYPAPIDWRELAAMTRIVPLYDASDPHPEFEAAYALVLQLFSLFPDVEFLQSDPKSNALIPWNPTTDAGLDRIPAPRLPTAQELLRLVREIEAAGDAAEQGILWVADSFALDKFDVEKIAEVFRDSRVEFHGVGLRGNKPPFEAMDTLARGTLGQSRLPVSGTERFPVDALSNVLAALFDIVEHFGVLLRQRCTLLTLSPLPDGITDGPRSPYRHISNDTRGCELSVLVESDAESAVFAIVQDPADALQFRVYRPDGTPLIPEREKHAEQVGNQTTPLQAFVVRKPVAGRWILRIDREDDSCRTEFDLYAAVRNPQLGARLTTQPLNDGTWRIQASADLEKPLEPQDPTFLTVERLDNDGNAATLACVPLLPLGPDAPQLAGRVGATVPIAKAGRYRLRTSITNPGHAMLIKEAVGPPQFPNPMIVAPIPPFTRALEQNVHTFR